MPFFKEPFDKRWMRSFLEETVFSGIFFSSNVWILWVQRGYNFMALKVVHVFVLSKLLNHHACVCDCRICHKKNKKIIQIFQPFMLNWLENVTNMLIWFRIKCPPICELGTNQNFSLIGWIVNTLVQKNKLILLFKKLRKSITCSNHRLHFFPARTLHQEPRSH